MPRTRREAPDPDDRPFHPDPSPVGGHRAGRGRLGRPRDRVRELVRAGPERPDGRADHRLDRQITGLSGPPVGTKATIIGNHGGTTPGNTDCDFRLTTTVNPASSGEPSDVDIAVQSYDPSWPDEYQSNRSEQRTDAAGHPDAFSDHPRLPGGSSCFFDGSMLNCVRGDYLFTIGGTGHAASQSDPSWVNRALLPVAVKVGSELQ